MEFRKSLTDLEAFSKAVCISLAEHGTDSVAIDHYNEIVGSLMFYPTECLAETINIIGDFATGDNEDAMSAKHNGHTWRELVYAVFGEFTNRIAYAKYIPMKDETAPFYENITYFLEDHEVTA